MERSAGEGGGQMPVKGRAAAGEVGGHADEAGKGYAGDMRMLFLARVPNSLSILFCTSNAYLYLCISNIGWMQENED